MHEVSLMISILDMVAEELQRHGAHRLIRVRVRYGTLSNVVPEAMHMAFEALIAGTANEGAELELVEAPLTVTCRSCNHSFAPPDRNALFGLCPHCQEITTLKVEQGSGLLLEHLEAE